MKKKSYFITVYLSDTVYCADSKNSISNIVFLRFSRILLADYEIDSASVVVRLTCHTRKVDSSRAGCFSPIEAAKS